MPWGDKDRGEGGTFEYDFAIHSARAGYTEYNEGKTCLLILEGEKTFSNGRVLDDHMWVSAPSGWTASDDGRFFVNTEDEDARFSKNSKIQRFINSAVDAGVPLQDRSENSLDTSGWVGLKVRIQEKEETFKPKDSTEVRSFTQPLVVAYLGEGSTSGSATNSVSTTSPSPTSNGGGGEDKKAAATLIARAESDLISHMDRVNKELGLPLDHEYCSAAFYESARG